MLVAVMSIPFGEAVALFGFVILLIGTALSFTEER